MEEALKDFASTTEVRLVRSFNVHITELLNLISLSFPTAQ